MGEGAPPSRGVIGDRLDHLIKELHPPGRPPFSEREIARKMAEKAEPDVPTLTHASISNIRNGTTKNPGVDSLRALAKFFGVPVAYFLDDNVAEVTDRRMREIKEGAERARASDELAEVLEDNDVRAIAFRLNGLSTKALRGIRGIVEGARDSEGLPQVEEKTTWRRRSRS
ncbi:helix-turn-helix domain-containing protein [Streptomyces sp. PCS3-D2]|uniref:helix-turn-helix domain-containing protein n=1 Tax=Streptomyces sp. PCS3-D2 TaxID=1460244 RepID=UPI000446A9E3|nr:helix-turn-helix domain-containing protein [Streptomyces sp. PCS3-D2]WKV74198.1 helix-turn-helix domain-containing protein [Streptomyces sp. PCS3-D2]